MNIRSHDHTSLGLRLAVGIVIILVILSIAKVWGTGGSWLDPAAPPANHPSAPALTLIAITPSTGSATPAATLMRMEVGATEITPSFPAKIPSGTQEPAESVQSSSQPGWGILLPTYLPDGYHIESEYFDQGQQMVILTYLATRPLDGAADGSLTSTKTITLLQAQRNDFAPMQIGPGASISNIQLNDQPAQYTVGAWDTEYVADQDGQGGQMVSRWRNDLQVKNIYWQVGDIFLALISNDETLSKQDLIDIAASVGKEKPR